MKLSLQESELGLTNSTTRIPFRYGNACMTCCPQVVLRVSIEIQGRRQAGYAADCLPPRWFDKSPEKSYRQQLEEMFSAIARAQTVFAEQFATSSSLFPTWLTAYQEVHRWAQQQGLTPLLASFGSSFLERAIIDAVCRAEGISFFQAARQNRLGLEPGRVHPQLAGLSPWNWLPDSPRTSIYIRHTVGLGDPLTVTDLERQPDLARLADGRPRTLEEYVRQSGISYFKIKVGNELERDLDRLQSFAAIVERQRAVTTA